MKVHVRLGEQPDILHLSIISISGVEHTIGRYIPSEGVLELFYGYYNRLFDALKAIRPFIIITGWSVKEHTKKYRRVRAVFMM